MSKLKWKLSSCKRYATRDNLTITWNHTKDVYVLFKGSEIIECGSREKCLKVANNG